MSSIYSNCPVKFEKLQLAERMSSPTTMKTFFNFFEQEVGWLIESSTQIIYKYNGVIIKEGTTNNDYYGFLTSMNEAADEAKKIAETLKLNENSELDICLLVNVERTPVKLCDSPDGIRWNKEEGKKKMYSKLFPDDSYIFINDSDKISAYLEQINSKDENTKFNAWEIISPLIIEKQTVIENFEVGSFKNGFDQNLEQFNEEIGKFM